MNKIKIKKHTEGDSRVAKSTPTFEDFRIANLDHIDDVRRLAVFFADNLITLTKKHDYSKIEEPYASMFYSDLCDTLNGRIKFTDGEWYRLHYTELERHHLNAHVPDDVMLWDVIEMLCDCVAAGMARNASRFYEPVIAPEVLTKAVHNTVEALKEQVEVI